MAKPNYAFAKRQRDLAKKQKKEEKKLRKAVPGAEGGDPAEQQDPDAQVASQGDTGGESAASSATPAGAGVADAGRQPGQA
jgi:hypothetical protein